VVSTAHALRQRGWQVEVVGQERTVAADRFRSEGLSFQGWASLSLKRMGSFRRLLRSYSPDWVIAFGGPETWLVHGAPKAKGRQFSRFFGYRFAPPSVLWVHRWLFARFDSVLFPCKVLEEACTWVPPSRKVTVPLGLSVDRFSPVAKTPVWREAPTLLIFGRLDPVKGHAQFLSLFAKFLLSVPSEQRPRLCIVGKPANTSVAELKAVAQALDIGSQVSFVSNQVEDVAALMASATVGVVCSLGSELICRVAQEFLLCGTPVLVSDAGALGEVLAFPEAGAQYVVEEEAKALQILQALYERSRQETLEDRLARGQVAGRYFSLACMGQALETPSL